MEIHVISRKKDKVRRENMTNMLSSSPITWSFFDAYESDTIPFWFTAIYNEKKTINYRSYALAPAEQGCFSSHISLWMKCFHSNIPFVILEDDCTLLNDFFSTLEEIKQCKHEYVKLEKRSDGYNLDEIFMINKKNRSGLVGYFLTPIAAFKLLSNLNSIYMPADHYVGFCWHHHVKPIGLINEVVTHENKIKTTIQHERKEKEKIASKNKWLRLKRKLRRWYDIVQYNIFIRNINEYKEKLN